MSYIASTIHTGSSLESPNRKSFTTLAEATTWLESQYGGVISPMRAWVTPDGKPNEVVWERHSKLYKSGGRAAA
jgi:hypothetical protein